MNPHAWDAWRKHEFPSEHFYSEPETKGAKEKTWKLLLITLSPFIIEIIDLFIKSINLFFHTSFRLGKEDWGYYVLSAFVKIEWLIVMAFYWYKNQSLYLKNSKDKPYQTDFFYFVAFILVQKIIPHSGKALVRMFAVGDESRKYAIEALNSTNYLLQMLLIVAFITFYCFQKYTLVNGFNKLFYAAGIFNDQGKYVVKTKATNSTQISYVWSYIFCALSLMILLSTISVDLTTRIRDALSSKTGSSIVESKNQKEIIAQLKNPSQTLMMVFQILIIAPLFEEILFRHVIMKVNNYKISSICISSFIFADAHINHDWNKNIWQEENILQLLQYLIPSLVLTYVYYKNRNLFLTIIIHFLTNLTSLIAIIIKNPGILSHSS